MPMGDILMSELIDVPFLNTHRDGPRGGYLISLHLHVQVVEHAAKRSEQQSLANTFWPVVDIPTFWCFSAKNLKTLMIKPIFPI